MPPDGSPLASYRRVAVLAFPGAQLPDVAGPLEVFAAATLYARRTGMDGPRYEVTVLSPAGGPVRCSSGLDLGSAALASVRSDEFDTVLAADGPGLDASPPDPQLLAFLRAAAAPGGARRVGSVCTGAFLLAAAGLLDGRRATTHWAYAARLAALHPSVRVEPDPIFLCDGGIWTSAGVTAGMDLALALVEEDAGRPLALAVARGLVLFLKRPGGQSQFSAGLAAQVAEEARAPLRAVLAGIVAEPAADHRVDALAARAGMSPRSFARAFAAAVGVTPARFVERGRLEAAQRLLEDTALALERVAERSGFASAEVMRRAFLRRLRTSPTDHRARFRRVPGPTQEHLT